MCTRVQGSFWLRASKRLRETVPNRAGPDAWRNKDRTHRCARVRKGTPVPFLSVWKKGDG